MQACDSLTIEGGINSYALMQQAAATVADYILSHYEARPVLVLIGPGNNGGDGFVIARALQAANLPVRVTCMVEESELSGDAAKAAQDCTVERVPFEVSSLGEAALIVDALFGTGLSRPIEGTARQLIEAINNTEIPVVAVDIPSGIAGDSGAVLGAAFKAEHTVTFCRAQYGHVLLPGREHCGMLHISDIGITDETVSKQQAIVWHNHPALWEAALAAPAPDGHKYMRGHVAVLGGAESPGAAKMAAHAALRVGAGASSILAEAQAFDRFVQDQLAVMVKKAETDFDVWFDDKRLNTVIAGPGAGDRERLSACIEQAIATKKRLVLDADAITLMAEKRDAYAGSLPSETILTPHEGEFERLFGDAPNGSKLEKAQWAAKTIVGVVVYKGGDTVIASPNGQAVINSHASPYLATAGSGDVLAGMCAGLMAQGMPAFQAACAAVWVHGDCALRLGAGVIATDLIGQIPYSLRQFI